MSRAASAPCNQNRVQSTGYVCFAVLVILADPGMYKQSPVWNACFLICLTDPMLALTTPQQPLLPAANISETVQTAKVVPVGGTDTKCQPMKRHPTRSTEPVSSCKAQSTDMPASPPPARPSAKSKASTCCARSSFTFPLCLESLRLTERPSMMSLYGSNWLLWSNG